MQRKVGEENTQSNDWEFRKSERENEKMRSLKTKAQKIEIEQETQESCTAQRPFIFYDCHDTSQRPQNPRATDGTDEFNLPERSHQDQRVRPLR